MRSTLLGLFLLLVVFTNCQKDNLNTTNPSQTPTVAPPTDGFWQKDIPTAHGFSESAIAEIIEAANKLDNFYALLIVRNGKLVVEEYFDNHNYNSLFELRSITKNVTSALTGIALEKQWIPSVAEPIHTYFPQVEMTGQKKEITFEHLLNMSSGLSWDESGRVLDLIQQRIPKSIDYILNQPVVTSPGTDFDYNSLSPHVVADVLVRQSNQPLLSVLAKKELFDPLGITTFDWTTDPEGANWGGFGLRLRARDLAKFGQLYLNEGKWEGQQLIPAEWVQQSAEKQMSTANSGYSYQWWVSTQSETPIFYGQGFGGQGLILLPEKDLMVIALQEAWIPPSQSSQQWNNFANNVFDPILKALDK